MDKAELEKYFKELENKLSIQTVRREKHSKDIKSMNIELGRINDKIDELSKEIIAVVEALRKFQD